MDWSIAGPQASGKRFLDRLAGSPSGERLFEDPVARSALLERHDSALAAFIDQRQIEPLAILEETKVVRDIRIDALQCHPEEAFGDLRRSADKRLSTRILGRLHHNTRHVANALARKSGRRLDDHFHHMA